MTGFASSQRANGSRSHALDALRGLAILAMLLSSEMPFGANALPSWMYHAQVPPPTHQFMAWHWAAGCARALRNGAGPA
jgi:uncharacterized membrane protein